MRFLICFAFLGLPRLDSARGAALLRGGDSTLFNDSVTILDEYQSLRKSPLLQHQRRKLQTSSPIKFFEPLACNQPKCGQGATYWKQGGFDPTAGMVVIPCGVCVWMDYDASDTLVLPHGIDIIGTLSFPNGYRITIETPFVRVQGNLEMFAQRIVTGEPNIRFVLTGSSDVSFIPAENNRFKCGPNNGATNPSACNVGFKPIVVAGGRVFIRGVPSDCTTWVRLEDVVRGSLPNPVTSTNGVQQDSACPTTLMDENFNTNANSYGWTGGYGAEAFISDGGTFRVTERKANNDHAPTWDTVWSRDCLVPNQTYLFSARIRLFKAGKSLGDKTLCAVSNTDCLTLFATTRTLSNQFGTRKGYWSNKHDIRYERWYNFHATFEFLPEEVAPSNVFHILQLRGPEAGVVIEMDNARLTEPLPSTLPPPSNPCSGNLVINGDAHAHSIHPFPLSSTGGAVLSVQRENDNNFFRLSARSTDQESIVHYFQEPGCFVGGALYAVSARIRIHSSAAVNSRIEIWSEFADGSSKQRTLLSCPGTTGISWTVCSGAVSLPSEVLGSTPTKLRLQLETLAAPTAVVDIDDLSMEFHGGGVTSIIVPEAGVASCWGAGSDILITSHTLNYDDGQVRKIVGSPVSLGNGFVRINLNEQIVPPTTYSESPDFAVEVALLSRNILFEGATDPIDDLFGAHFMVMQTPSVQQVVDGVEFRNFGQQGILGRYPIHFHLCDNVKGTVVKRNSIRDSKQRCIVIHGTHNVTVDGNIAYDTFGHCFMGGEDGGEVDNSFIRNLGALTKIASRPVSSLETDHLLPSTFWCSNPQNTWLGNVAAGSKDNGFWFELRDSVQGPTADMPLSDGMSPKTMNLLDFRNNVAHSNGKHGLRTYPFGYMPPTEAVFHNTRSYRNKWEGFFAHNSRNIALAGGVLADNRIQADLDRADDVRIQGTRIIGVSDSFRSVSESQGTNDHSDLVVGVELHAFAHDSTRSGATLSNLRFSGFESADHVKLVRIDDEVWTGHWNYWTTMQNVVIDQGSSSANRFDFTQAAANGVVDVYITDRDSSMKPAGVSSSGVATVISDSSLMKAFLDTSTCTAVPKDKYLYCPGACFRTVSYAVDPAETDSYSLRVVNQNGRVTNFPGFYFQTQDPLKDRWLRQSRYFSAALPSGIYSLSFRNANGGLIWPSHAEVAFEDPQCNSAVGASAISLQVPAVSNNDCQELIRNGNVEASATSARYWLQHEAGLQVLASRGIGGSRAVSDTSRNTNVGAIGQFLDTRCLVRGYQYQVRAWVKLLTPAGAVKPCDSASGCPRAKLRFRKPPSDPSEHKEHSVDLVTYFVRPYNTNNWNLLQGVFTVDERLASASSVSFFVERQSTGNQLILDNVSISLIGSSCNELVFNGNFADGSSRFWERSASLDSLKMEVINIGGNAALEMSGRTSLTHSPQQQVRVGCMQVEDWMMVKARLRLKNDNGSVFDCNPTQQTGNLACPRLKLRAFVDVGLTSHYVEAHAGGSVAVTDHGVTSDGWLTVSGFFSATAADEAADRLVLVFDQVSSNKDFAIDDVTITPTNIDCDELITNGNLELGDTPRFWRSWANNGNAALKLVPGLNGSAVKVFKRELVGDGLHQFVDPRCVTKSSLLRVMARMKVIHKISGQAVPCEPNDTTVAGGCPAIRVGGWIGSQKVFEQKHHMTNRPVWSPPAFNTYETEILVSDALAACDRVSIGFRNYNLDWDLVVDNFSVQRV